MPATANVTLHLQGFTHTVQTIQGQEALSQPFHYQIATAADVRIDSQAQIGQPASLVFVDDQGVQRVRPGVVSAIEETFDELRVTLEPRLALGRGIQNTRLFLYRTRRQLIEQCLSELGYGRDQILWLAEGRETDQKPALLQAGESHLDFIQRLLAELGCFFWHAGDLDNEQICIADNLIQTAFIPPVITFDQARKAALNGEPPPLRQQWLTAQPEQQFPNDARPTEPSGDGQPKRDTFLPMTQNMATRAAEQSRRHQQAISQQWQLEGTFPTLSAGCSVTLPPTWHRTPPGPELTVLSLTLEGQVYDTARPETGLRLSVNARLISRASAYQPDFPEPPHLPLAFPAQVESRSAYAELDDQGRYQLRFSFTDRNTETLAHTDASLPTERMQSFANANQDEATGWHYPLLDRSRILVTLLNNDPNRPCILGFAPALDQTGPVTTENDHQNRTVTPGRNEWLLDDEPHRIALQTFDSQNLLELDASGESPLIKLASQYGMLRLHAGKNINLQAAENLTQKHGGQASTQVKQNSTEQTDDQRHLQSAKQQVLRAKDSIEQTSDNSQQWQMKTGGLSILAANAVTLKSQGAQITRISDGSYRVQAPNDITLTGTDGDMLISNGTGGVRLSRDGTIKLFGAKITLKGQTCVTFNGDVEYELGAANEAEAAEAVEPEEIEGIEALLSESTPFLHKPMWSNREAKLSSTVGIKVSYQGLEPNSTIVFTIEQVNPDESVQTIYSSEISIQDAVGIQELFWQLPTTTGKTARLNSRENIAPYRLRVKAASDGVESDWSELMQVNLDFVIKVKTENDLPEPDGTFVFVESADGRLHQGTVKDGRARLENIASGPLSLRIDKALHK